MVRRSLSNRPEIALSLALAEIERLKAITSRITDGRQIVLIPGAGAGPSAGGGDEDEGGGGIPPVATSAHVLYGAKHTRSFRVTAAEGISLVIFYGEGQIWQGGTFITVAAGTLMMTDATTNYVFVQAGGVATNTTGFPLISTPLAEVVTAGGTITAVNDRRSYLLPGAGTSGSLHDADQIIDADGDTSVEVERGADDDTIRLKAAQVDVALIGVAGQWQLPVVGVGAGILLGGDAQLYRSANDVLAVGVGDTLRIDDANFLLAMIGANPRITADANDYWEYNRAGNYYDWVIGSTLEMRLHSTGRLELPIGGSGAGLLVGGDCLWYRTSASVWRTPDFVVMDSGLIVSAALTVQGAVGLTVGVSDTVRGIVRLHGSAGGSADGGIFQVYLAADHDGVFEFWGVDAKDDDLRFSTSDAVVNNRMTAEGQLQMPISGSGAGLLLGGDVLLYRSNADELTIPDDVVITGDTWWTGDGSGLPYGCMHGYNMAEIVGVAATDTWYELTAGLVSVEANLMTFQNNHELKVTKGGRYVVNWSASIQTSAANDEIEGAMAVNNTADTTTAAHVTMVKANAAMCVSGGAVVDLAANDVISVAFLNHSAIRDIDVEHVTVTVVMVGGT